MTKGKALETEGKTSVDLPIKKNSGQIFPRKILDNKGKALVTIREDLDEQRKGLGDRREDFGDQRRFSHKKIFDPTGQIFPKCLAMPRKTSKAKHQGVGEGPRLG